MRGILSIAYLFIIVCFTLIIGLGQTNKIKPDLIPRGCEYNNIALEGARKKAGTRSVIILIARPGKKDRLKAISERRLYTARAYLTSYLTLPDEPTVVTANGENSGGLYGVIEIYVTGILFDSLASYPNYELGLGSCDSLESDDEDSRAKRSLLYPWLFRPKKI